MLSWPCRKLSLMGNELLLTNQNGPGLDVRMHAQSQVTTGCCALEESTRDWIREMR